MSAYIVEKKHILYLVEAATDRRIGVPHGGCFSWYHREVPALRHTARRRELHCGDYDRAAEVANMLWCENIKSVSHRYPNESSGTLPGPRNCGFVIEPHNFSSFTTDFDPIQVIKACHCYEYQSCEHPEWETSEAYCFIESLKSAAVRQLPGYESAAWGIPEKRAVNSK